jgi:uroporphyrinogen decarboxylase
MKSRERIISSINHKEPDKVPIDFNSHRSSGISVQAYKNLRKYLGLKPSKLYVYDIVQQLAIVEDDILDIFNIDVVQLGYDYYKKNDYWKDWELEDGTLCKIPSFINIEQSNKGNIIRGDEGQIIASQRKGCLYFEQTYFPFESKKDDIFKNLPYFLDQVMWCRAGTPPSPAGFDSVGILKWEEAAKNLRSSSDRAIYGTFGGNLVEIGQYLFRFDNFYMELASNPNKINCFLNTLTDLHLSNLDKFLSATGKSIDIIGFADDMGMQTGTQISQEMYRKFFKSRHAILWKHAKSRFPHLKVALHSCGSVYSLLKDLIEAGLDIIQPVQISAKDMDLKKLKKEFGRDIVFWGGGCDTKEILPFGTVNQVKKHVKENVRIMVKGGGFVFQQVHNILANVPPQNIVAMFEAVSEESR